MIASAFAACWRWRHSQPPARISAPVCVRVCSLVSSNWMHPVQLQTGRPVQNDWRCRRASGCGYIWAHVRVPQVYRFRCRRPFAKRKRSPARRLDGSAARRLPASGAASVNLKMLTFLRHMANNSIAVSPALPLMKLKPPPRLSAGQRKLAMAQVSEQTSGSRFT